MSHFSTSKEQEAVYIKAGPAALNNRKIFEEMMDSLSSPEVHHAVIQISDNKDEIDDRMRSCLFDLRKRLIETPNLSAKVLHHNHVIFKKGVVFDPATKKGVKTIKTMVSKTEISGRNITFQGIMPEPYSKEMTELVETVRHEKPETLVCRLNFNRFENRSEGEAKLKNFKTRTEKFLQALRIKLAEVGSLQSIEIQTPSRETAHSIEMNTSSFRQLPICVRRMYEACKAKKEHIYE
ncbi:MAG: hypothetical protein J6U64_04680 [Alphaproteobacteria bacterium]|nr:hypothetical protein [Alphaproteobacteria bacterium]